MWRNLMGSIGTLDRNDRSSKDGGSVHIVQAVGLVTYPGNLPYPSLLSFLPYLALHSPTRVYLDHRWFRLGRVVLS